MKNKTNNEKILQRMKKYEKIYTYIGHCFYLVLFLLKQITEHSLEMFCFTQFYKVP